MEGDWGLTAVFLTSDVVLSHPQINRWHPQIINLQDPIGSIYPRGSFLQLRVIGRQTGHCGFSIKTDSRIKGKEENGKRGPFNSETAHELIFDL